MQSIARRDGFSPWSCKGPCCPGTSKVTHTHFGPVFVIPTVVTDRYYVKNEILEEFISPADIKASTEKSPYIFLVGQPYSIESLHSDLPTR